METQTTKFLTIHINHTSTLICKTLKFFSQDTCYGLIAKRYCGYMVLYATSNRSKWSLGYST